MNRELMRVMNSGNDEALPCLHISFDKYLDLIWKYIDMNTGNENSPK